MSTQMIVTILYFIYLIGVFIINFLGYSARNYSSWMSVFTLLSSWNQGAIFHSWAEEARRNEVNEAGMVSMVCKASVLHGEESRAQR